MPSSMLPSAAVALVAALGLAAAKPLAPASDRVIDLMSPASAAAHCTTWLTHTNYGYRPHSTTPVWTEYLATSTHYASVDCGCCDVLASTTVMAPGYGGHGPFQPFIGRTTASTALVVTRTVCNSPMSGCHIQPTPSPSTPPDDDGGDDDDDDDDGDDDSTTTSTVVAATTTATAPTTTATPVSTSTRKHSTHTPLLPATTASRNTGCTSTRSHYLSLLHGPTNTVWTSTAVVTSHVPCGGCLFVATAGLGGHGPAFLASTTVTATTPTTSTTFVCQKTPSAFDGRDNVVQTAA